MTEPGEINGDLLNTVANDGTAANSEVPTYDLHDQPTPPGEGGPHQILHTPFYHYATAAAVTNATATAAPKSGRALT